MGCIHPRQIPVVHENYAPPDNAEIERAKKIVNAFIIATEKGLGVVSLGSKMIDPPVVIRAQTTIDMAIDVGKLDETGGMNMSVKMLENAVGRMVPTEVNGKEQIPFKGGLVNISRKHISMLRKFLPALIIHWMATRKLRTLRKP